MLSARITASHAVKGLSAGSALLEVDQALIAVPDDAFALMRIALPSLARTRWVLEGDGAPLPKALKPDFEAAVRAGDGSVHLLGSGSTERRCAIAHVDLEARTVTRAARPDLYAAVAEALALAARPNVEGAIVRADRLVLLHRGVGAQPSGLVELPAEALRRGPARALAAHPVALGALDGITLGFTDAALLGDGRIAFVASAEDSDDPVADGPVVGSVLGVLEQTSRGIAARWTRLLEADGTPCRAKVEGLTVDADGRAAWVLTDPDDPALPARLARVALAGL